MAKKSKIKIHSIQYENENGELHVAVIPQQSVTSTLRGSREILSLNLSENCNCGDQQCINGIKYRCIQDPFGDCVWMKTSERC